MAGNLVLYKKVTWHVTTWKSGSSKCSLSLIDVAWMQKVQQTALKDRLYMDTIVLSTKSLQILSLLEAMDLGQYREVFHREHITGEILVECTEEVLQNELEITSKIHRIRLIKIISGQHSASNFLKTWHLATA